MAKYSEPAFPGPIKSADNENLQSYGIDTRLYIASHVLGDIISKAANNTKISANVALALQYADELLKQHSESK